MLGRVDCGELLGKIGEVRESKLSRVGLVGDTQEAYGVLYYVATRAESAITALTSTGVAYCSVYCPDSMLACCSEFLLSLLKIIFACDLTSASSVSI